MMGCMSIYIHDICALVTVYGDLMIIQGNHSNKTNREHPIGCPRLAFYADKRKVYRSEIKDLISSYPIPMLIKLLTSISMLSTSLSCSAFR